MWCERYWMSCYNDIIWGERERTLAISSAHSRCSVHCIIHSLHHCVHHPLCEVQCASMYKCAPHVCSVYQCTVWLSIELCASMFALYTHWLHCNALYAHFASMWALYNTMHTLLQNVYNIHTANYIVYTLCSLNWTLAVQMICCDTVSKGRDRN